MRPLHYFPFYSAAQQMPINRIPQMPINRIPQMPFQSYGIPNPTRINPVQTSSIDQWINSANQLMQSAQKFGPLVQQASPMLKNLPAIWKLYRSFSKSSTEPTLSKKALPINQTPIPKNVPPTLRPSIPKIYQPPFENFLD